MVVVHVITIIDCCVLIISCGMLLSGFPARNRNFSDVIYIEISKNKDFVVAILDRQEYKFGNVPIGFANLKNVYLYTKTIMV